MFSHRISFLNVFKAKIISVIIPEYNGDGGLSVGKALIARLQNALKAKKYYKTMPAIAKR